MSHSGIVDLIPGALRKQWIADGSYPNRSVFDVFQEQAHATPDKAAVLTLEETITYRQLLNASLRLANSLHNVGVVEGDVVVYQLPNSWHCCAIDLAVAALGGIVAPFPLGRGRLDMEALLRRCDARVFIGVPHYGDMNVCNMINALRPTQLSLRHIILHGPTTTQPKGWLNLDTLLQAPAIAIDQLPTVSPDSPVRFLVSSGTESEPKLIAYSHNALLGGRGKFLQRLQAGNTSKNQSQTNQSQTHSREFRGLYLVPLGSAFGSTATFGALSFLGGSVVLLPTFDSARAVDAIAQLQPTHLLGVPTMFQRIAMEANLVTIDKSSLHTLVSGGAAIDEATINRCRHAFDCEFVNLYGSADGVNCHNMPNDDLNTILGSVGKPNPAICDIKIMDEAGHEVAQGESGEIFARGPISPMQYVNAPGLDARYRDAEGWVRTGDLGTINAQGYLVLTGRKKDIIIRGGVNISPVQIEKLTTRHPHIIGAACVAVEDNDVGHRICICLMLRDGSEHPSLTSLCDFLISEGLEVNKLPEYLRFYRVLPLNPAGKIDKQQLTQDLHYLSRSSVTQLRAS